MTMARARRKRVKKPTNTTQSNLCQDNWEQSNQQDKKLNIRWKHGDTTTTEKSSTTSQSVHRLDKAVVLLEDIAINFSHATERTVLGDKTNQSSMSPRNQKQKNLNGSTDKKSLQKMSCNLPASINEERSTYELSNNRNLSSARKSPLDVVSSEGNLENQAKSSKFSENCIYTKVQRETLRNKNMPLEEKLAQYEFEVDENEPVVKKKKVTRRKKVKSKEEYCPPSKIFTKIFQAGVEEAEEKIKAKPKNVANLKSEFVFPFGDNSTESTRGGDVQHNALSPLGPVSNRGNLRSSKNLTPVGRPDGETEKRSVESGNIVDLEDNVDNAFTNNTLHNTSLCEKSLPNLDQDVSVISCTPTAMPIGENRCNNKSDICKSPNQVQPQLASSFNSTVLTPFRSYGKDARFSLSKVTVASTPFFQSTPLNRHCQATTNVSHSVGECTMNNSVNQNKRIFVVPRESGGVNNSCENVLAQNWSVDNCFGFDDDSEERTELSPLRDISSKRRLRNNSSVISSISYSNKRKKNNLKGKENGISPFVKRKSGITALVSPNKSFKLGIKDKNTSSVMNKSNASINTSTEEHSERELDTSVIEKPSPVTLGLSPYSKPLKQTKLDFIAIESNISTCETPKKDDRESPLLFKDADDKTPIHFKEPARRSYVRSVRKKMRPVGFEWIEADSESEGEGESSHHPIGIKRKRVKLNKNEEKEANKWMKDFNRQCEEIEGFELCVEK